MPGNFANSGEEVDVEYRCRIWRMRRGTFELQVKISAQKCEIWTGTQFQTLDQMVAGKITD